MRAFPEGHGVQERTRQCRSPVTTPREPDDAVGASVIAAPPISRAAARRSTTSAPAHGAQRKRAGDAQVPDFPALGRPARPVGVSHSQTPHKFPAATAVDDVRTHPDDDQIVMNGRGSYAPAPRNHSASSAQPVQTGSGVGGQTSRTSLVSTGHCRRRKYGVTTMRSAGFRVLWMPAIAARHHRRFAAMVDGERMAAVFDLAKVGVGWSL